MSAGFPVEGDGRSFIVREVAVIVAAIAIAIAGALVPNASACVRASCPAALTIWGDADYRNRGPRRRGRLLFGTDVASSTDRPTARITFVRALSIPPVPGTSLKNTSWNDCISSFKFTGSCHYRVRLYEDDDYGSTFRGPWILPWGSVKVAKMADLGANDQVSSIRFSYRETCPRPNETSGSAIVSARLSARTTGTCR